jgi:hypothetical protein
MPSGGEGGIRTPGTLASTPHFECGAFNHSATSPALSSGRRLTWTRANRPHASDRFRSDACLSRADACLSRAEVRSKTHGAGWLPTAPHLKAARGITGSVSARKRGCESYCPQRREPTPCETNRACSAQQVNLRGTFADVRHQSAVATHLVSRPTWCHDPLAFTNHLPSRPTPWDPARDSARSRDQPSARSKAQTASLVRLGTNLSPQFGSCRFFELNCEL